MVHQHFQISPQKPVEDKFHVDIPWDAGSKVCTNDHGHMTKMAAMTIYGKHLLKSSLKLIADVVETW